MAKNAQSLRVRLREAEAKARQLADALKAREAQRAVDTAGPAFRQGLPTPTPRQGKSRAGTAGYVYGQKPGDVIAVPKRLVTWTRYI